MLSLSRAPGRASEDRVFATATTARPIGPGAAGRRARALARAVAAAALLAAVAGCAPRTSQPPASTSPSAAKPQETIEELYAQIDTLDFLNRLQLADRQAAALADLLKAEQQKHEQVEAEREALREQLRPLLERKRQALTADEAVPEEVSSGIAGLEARIADLVAPDAQHESVLAASLRKTLTPEQVRIVAGGLEARMDASDMLDGFRELPAEAFNSEIGPLSEELASRGSGMKAVDVQALFTEARSLSEEEYKANRATLIRQLEPLFVPSGDTADWLLTRAFSDPYLLRLLSRKGTQGN